MSGIFVCVPPPRKVDPMQRTRGGEGQRVGLYKPKRWPAGQKEVHVRFLDGDPLQWEVVREIMEGPDGWNAVCGLQFRFVQHPQAQVRVSFQSGGSWSHVGDAGIDESQPTMNFGWLHPTRGSNEARRVVLHEFGHALGLIHEHQNPWGGGVPWNLPYVFAFYRERMGWDEEMTRAQVLEPYAREVVESSAEVDGESIMGYAMDERFFTKPGFFFRGSLRISPTDAAQVAEWYGPPPVRWRKTWMPGVEGTEPPAHDDLGLPQDSRQRVRRLALNRRQVDRADR